MNKKAAIIIVNWNGKKFLKDCLSSVYKQTYKNFNVYFVDNGSIDGSVDFVKKNFPKTKIIELDKNYGFAKGNNIGISKTLKDKKVEYIILLNNDTIVDKNWLLELLKVYESSPHNLGGIQSKIILKESNKIHSSGIRISRDLSTYPEGFYDTPDLHNRSKKIFSPIGCAAAFKKEALKDVLKNFGEIFDNEYFCYREDDDLGWKLNLIRYYSMYCPSSIVYHLHSSSSGKVSSNFKIFYTERNRVFNLLKYMPLYYILISPIYTIKRYFYDFKRLKKLRCELSKDINKRITLSIFWIVLKAYFSAFLNIKKIIKKREKAQVAKKISSRDILGLINKYKWEHE